MNEQQITFPSQNLTLEGLYAPAATGAAPKGAVVCHPHPQYGGSMYNNVVDAALEALWQRGFATLRFNFRGVGESEGSYGGGEGEAQDAAAAVSYMRAQPGMQAAPIVPGRLLLWCGSRMAGRVTGRRARSAGADRRAAADDGRRFGSGGEEHPFDRRVAGFVLPHSRA